jgi:hypothetical protein
MSPLKKKKKSLNKSLQKYSLEKSFPKPCKKKERETTLHFL